ncbi:MAG: chorismate mutase [Candidatus Marsarchaeota archaeon]|jgi:chorismate mutase|nr:chorismate mutase [Candidatus Marsarchaeota archaeon]
MNDPKKTLEDSRKSIDAITREMVRLIRKRDLVVRKVIEAKRQLGIPALNAVREKALIRKARDMAEKAGVDPLLMEKITRLIIDNSRKYEESSLKKAR